MSNPRNIAGRYGLNILIGIDQLMNTLAGGDPDETYSSRLGRIKRMHGGEIPWTRPIPKLIERVLDRIDHGHAEKSIEGDEGKDELFL